MATLEKITPELFSDLYEAFLWDDDPLSQEEDWRNVFDYQWATAEDNCGYALLEHGKVVGMMGMVYSDRTIAGEARKFCNLHTWWVREDHRGRSLALFRPVLKLQGYTITHFTPCETIVAITKRVGFQELDKRLRILLPLGMLNGKGAWGDSNLVYDEQVIEARLSEPDLKILLDHRPYHVGHLLVADASEYCYLLYTHVVRHRLPYCHIHYISNRELFAQREPAIRASLLRRHKARFVALDARLVRNMKFRLSFNSRLPAIGMVKSADVRPEQIDNLYSDIVFLKLTALPDVSYELRQFVRRCSPSWLRTAR